MVNTIMTNPDCKNKEFDKEVADKWYKCVCEVVQEFYKEDKHVFDEGGVSDELGGGLHTICVFVTEGVCIALPMYYTQVHMEFSEDQRKTNTQLLFTRLTNGIEANGLKEYFIVNTNT